MNAAASASTEEAMYMIWLGESECHFLPFSPHAAAANEAKIQFLSGEKLVVVGRSKKSIEAVNIRRRRKEGQVS